MRRPHDTVHAQRRRTATLRWRRRRAGRHCGPLLRTLALAEGEAVRCGPPLRSCRAVVCVTSVTRASVAALSTVRGKRKRNQPSLEGVRRLSPPTQGQWQLARNVRAHTPGLGYAPPTRARRPQNGRERDHRLRIRVLWATLHPWVNVALLSGRHTEFPDVVNVTRLDHFASRPFRRKPLLAQGRMMQSVSLALKRITHVSEEVSVSTEEGDKVPPHSVCIIPSQEDAVSSAAYRACHQFPAVCI